MINVFKLFSIIIAVTPFCASAQDEAQTRMKAELTRKAFALWHAMPIHNNFGVRVGDFVDIDTEAIAIGQPICFPNLSIRSLMGDTPEVIQLSISNRISYDLGVIVSGWISRVPVEVRAEASSMAESSSVSVISRERDVIPAQGIEWLVFNIDARVECDLLRNALEEWDGERLLVARVLGGVTIAKSEVASEYLTEISPSTDLGSVGAIAIGNESSSSTRSISIHLRPNGSLAIQPLKVDRMELMRVYAMRSQYPESWAQLELIVDSYISGEEPSPIEKTAAALREILQTLGGSNESFEDYRKKLFGSGAVQAYVNYDNLDVPQETWESYGTYAAAIEIIRSLPAN